MEMILHRKKHIHMFVNDYSYVTYRELRMMGMVRNKMTMMRRIECTGST